MAKVVLDLKNKDLDDKATFCGTLVTNMTGNLTYPTPNPPLADLTSAAADALAKKAAVATAKVALRNAVVAQDLAEKAMDDVLTLEGDYIQAASGGDKVKIESSGASVKSEATDSLVPPMVENLSLSKGDNEGDVDFQWNPVKGYNVSHYQFRLATVMGPGLTPDWQIAEATTTKSTYSQIGGTPLGERIWISVRAVNATGNGAWSDPATIIVS